MRYDRYTSVLRHPDLVRKVEPRKKKDKTNKKKKGGKKKNEGDVSDNEDRETYVPLLSDADMSRLLAKLTDRLQAVKASDATMTITDRFAEVFSKQYLKKGESANMTGQRAKQLTCVLMFILRDLAYEEVNRKRYHDSM
jgi:hypothetical protein